MRRTGIVVAALAVVVALGAGYWWGSRSRPDSAPVMAKPAVVPERRIAYYRNPMGLPDTSPVPKKDSMGMEYIPVYEGDELEGKQLQLSTEKIQKLGVKTETATLRDLARPIRAVGTLEVDERGLHTVTARFEGYVQRLYVNATGQSVGRGQPVAAVYSPDLVAAQREYLVARQGVAALKDADADARSRMRDLEGASLARLRYWQISDDQIEQLKRDGRVRETLTLHSPAAGVVLERMVVEGMRFMPGEPLLKIADLSTMWLLADVFEQDLALVRVGETATFRVNAFPDRAFRGRVSFIYPSLNPQTRTAKVRIELPNRDGALKPSMYATVEIGIAAGAGKVLTVPTSAVIHSGTREVVLVLLAEGRFEPRSVKLGMQGDEHVQILEGVAEGEKVVASANFLIDAESNLRAALSSLTPPGEPAAPHSATVTAPNATNKHRGD